MPRKNFNPKNFELDVDHPWTMAIHTNDMIVLNPQLDLDHPDDLDEQTRVSIDHIRKLLADVGCTVADITNLRVEYVNKGDVDEDTYRQSIVDQLPDLNGATIEMVPFDRLVLPELLVEICTYAMAKQDGSKLERVSVNPTDLHHPGAPLSQGLKCGKLVYVGQQVPRDENGTVVHEGDFSRQSALVLDQLNTVLTELGADLSDCVRLNVFYDCSVTQAEWTAFAKHLKTRFGDGPGPSLTAIPLPRLYPSGTKIVACAWAMRGEDGGKLEKKYAGLTRNAQMPDNLLWRHGIECADMVLVGGQAAFDADGSVQFANDHVQQTKQTMDNIDATLSELGLRLQDVHKINSYYVLSTVDEFNENLETRSHYFQKPGPGSVGLPLDSLSADGLRIEVEAILVKQ
ncbi:Rid family hydrolase [Roseibium sp. SCP14]|uniref:Rid family hydrolase n=1 Tax=Roseibium sp. SCP14 TaxID=3141375 RepID=UPI003338FD4C